MMLHETSDWAYERLPVKEDNRTNVRQVLKKRLDHQKKGFERREKMDDVMILCVSQLVG